jgi:hypothetical protein
LFLVTGPSRCGSAHESWSSPRLLLCPGHD